VSTTDAPDGLWAVTTFFNPLGLHSRLANYRRFRERLGVPLLSVELSYTGEYELRGEDADILVPLRGQAVLWQKERLLNVALRHLPADCQIVAWVDCDLLFEQGNWGERAGRALEQFDLVQLFETICDLPRACLPETVHNGRHLRLAESTGSWIVRGHSVLETLRSPNHRSESAPANGGAWVARREFLETHQFYDACILGSGDRAMLCAALGAFDVIRDALSMNDRQMAHFLDWAEPFFDSLARGIGCLEERVFHLWHGSPLNRQLGTRYRILEPHAFDPYTDIKIGDSGCWEWASHKPQMHQAAHEYFRSRRDDG
jgi:hypothetical protein